MKITLKQYAESLYQIVQGKDESEIKNVIENFVKVLQSNNDINKLDKVIEEFCKTWNKEEGIIETEVVSTKNLDNEIVELLNSYIAKLSGVKKVLVKQKIDKNILGGLIIKYKDKVLDGSLRMRLRELKIEMMR
ncbi:MAG: ATP synthase F1 subunit delta [Patescibacteria group bacterium]|nr:ATP synthase F1 subunit delta [Patescibacteria group bacterium]